MTVRVADDATLRAAPPEGGGTLAAALAYLRASDARTLEDMCTIAGIPAPTGLEAERGEWMAARLAEAGAEAVCTDAVGNVIAWLPAATRPDLPPIVLAAHLDTVFAPDTPLVPVRDGGVVRSPGIADNARGLAGLLALTRAVRAADWKSVHPIAMVATVGEEGSGDLRGAKHLMREGGPFRHAGAFIALDGSGSRQIVHRAVGSVRLRFEVAGPGGHSWADRGNANPLQALADAAAATRRQLVEGATITLTRLAGGQSVNAIPATAWMELDIRAVAARVLTRAVGYVRAAVERACDDENARRRAGSEPLRVLERRIGDRPVGSTRLDSPLVRAAEAATRHIGRTPQHVAASTDANVALALGIPAIALGAGGRSGATHTTAEWYDNEGGVEGLQRVLLTLATVAGHP